MKGAKGETPQSPSQQSTVYSSNLLNFVLDCVDSTDGGGNGDGNGDENGDGKGVHVYVEGQESEGTQENKKSAQATYRGKVNDTSQHNRAELMSNPIHVDSADVAQSPTKAGVELFDRDGVDIDGDGVDIEFDDDIINLDDEEENEGHKRNRSKGGYSGVSDGNEGPNTMCRHVALKLRYLFCGTGGFVLGVIVTYVAVAC